MFPVKVDKADPTDLYEQVAAEIRRAIADGEAKPENDSPPAKDLAAVLGVNTNTVLRSCGYSATKDCWSPAAGGSPSPQHPERGAVIQRHANWSTTPAVTATAATSHRNHRGASDRQRHQALASPIRVDRRVSE